jgi:hypothetical protein
MQSTGLEAQARALRTYCEANSLKNYIFYGDEGVSGTKANRPELDRLMTAVERGEVASVRDGRGQKAFSTKSVPDSDILGDFWVKPIANTTNTTPNPSIIEQRKRANGKVKKEILDF